MRFQGETFQWQRRVHAQGACPEAALCKAELKKKPQKNKESKNRLITTAITTNARRLHDVEAEAHRDSSRHGKLAEKQSRRYPVMTKEFPKS